MMMTRPSAALWLGWIGCKQQHSHASCSPNGSALTRSSAGGPRHAACGRITCEPADIGALELQELSQLQSKVSRDMGTTKAIDQHSGQAFLCAIEPACLLPLRAGIALRKRA